MNNESFLIACRGIVSGQVTYECMSTSITRSLGVFAVDFNYFNLKKTVRFLVPLNQAGPESCVSMC